jgi:hypothetical protein
MKFFNPVNGTSPTLSSSETLLSYEISSSTLLADTLSPAGVLVVVPVLSLVEILFCYSAKEFFTF